LAFARHEPTHAYYDRRAPEYDDWWRGTGLFEERERPGWEAETADVVALVAGLAPGRTLDIACGTGFLTGHLRGLAVGLDQSASMVAIAQSRLPDGLALVGDALDLPFADGAFDRILTSHFYGHLPPDERATFLAQARRWRASWWWSTRPRATASSPSSGRSACSPTARATACSSATSPPASSRARSAASLATTGAGSSRRAPRGHSRR